MKKIILVLIALFFLTVPALAFSDNFNSCDLSQWTITSGWTCTNSYPYDGTNYLLSSISMSTYVLTGGSMSTTYYANATVPSTNTYFEVTFNTTQSVSGAGASGDSSSIFRFLNNGTSYIEASHNTGQISTTGFSAYTIVGGSKWHRVVFRLTGSNLRRKIYNSSDYLVDDTTVSISVPVNPDRVQLIGSSTLSWNNQVSYRTVSLSSYESFDNVIASTTSPQAANTISWDKTTYTTGDTMSFSWAISDTDWAQWTSFYASLKLNGNPYYMMDFCIICWGRDVMTIGTQTGSFSFTPATGDTGMFNIGLSKGLTLPLATTLANASVRMNGLSTAYLTGSNSVSAFVPNSYSYSFGTGGITYPTIEIWYTDPVTNNPVINGMYQINPNNLPSGSINITFNYPTAYILKLKDRGTGKYYASPLGVQVVDSQAPITQNITTSSLSIDKTSYYYGQTMRANWQIDNVNFTSPNRTYLDLYNTDAKIITGEKKLDDGYWRCASGGTGISGIGTSQACGDYWILIQNSAFDVATMYWSSGNNQLRLISLNTVTNNKTVLAFANFSLSRTNLLGYGLEVVPNPVMLGQQVMINVTIPSTVTTASVTILNGDGTATVWNPNWYVAPGSQTLTWTPPKAGTYIVGLFSGTGTNQTLQMQVNLVVKAAAGTPTATGTAAATSQAWSKNPADSGYTAGMIDSQVSLLGMGVNNTSRFLFAMIWTIIFLVGGFAITGNNPSGGLYSAMLPIGFFTSLSFIQSGVEFFPRYTVIIIAFVIVIKTGLVK